MKRFIIGANNKTKKIEKQKAYKIISGYSKGFTSYETTGFWKGKREKSLAVEVEHMSNKNAYKVAKDLSWGLKQEAIMVQSIKSNCKFINQTKHNEINKKKLQQDSH